MAFRARFARDVVIDLVGYRRWGHNEGDEPAYTQPVMVQRIKQHPTVATLYAQRLVEQGVVDEEQVAEMRAHIARRLSEHHGHIPKEEAEAQPRPEPPATVRGLATAVDSDRLLSLNEALLTVPEGFTPHPKLWQQLERRREAVGEGGGIDWGHAEALAFASLLEDGTPIRLTGQDAERGTFSHRHLVLHDVGDRRDVHAAAAHPARQGELRGAQLAAERDGVPRVRVRLLGHPAGDARAVGGAVRRLRERRRSRSSTSSSRRAASSGASSRS